MWGVEIYVFGVSEHEYNYVMRSVEIRLMSRQWYCEERPIKVMWGWKYRFSVFTFNRQFTSFSTCFSINCVQTFIKLFYMRLLLLKLHECVFRFSLFSIYICNHARKYNCTPVITFDLHFITRATKSMTIQGFNQKLGLKVVMHLYTQFNLQWGQEYPGSSCLHYRLTYGGSFDIYIFSSKQLLRNDFR